MLNDDILELKAEIVRLEAENKGLKDENDRLMSRPCYVCKDEQVKALEKKFQELEGGKLILHKAESAGGVKKICKYCKSENPEPIFETLKNSVSVLKSGNTGLPILEIVQYAYELDINIYYCPMCGRKLEAK